jgi:hypothetical protein
MANTRSNNVWYVDTAHSSAADDLPTGVVLTAIVVTATAANGRIVLSDPNTAAIKLDLRVSAESASTSGDSRLFDFSNSPIVFPNGIRVSTLTTCVATITGRESGKGQ